MSFPRENFRKDYVPFVRPTAASNGYPPEASVASTESNWGASPEAYPELQPSLGARKGRSARPLLSSLRSLFRRITAGDRMADKRWVWLQLLKTHAPFVSGNA